MNKSNPRLSQQLEEQPLDTQGFDRPRALVKAIDEDLAPLLDLVQRPIVSASQFSRDQLLQLARLAARFETQPQMITRPLTGKILISAFYEPSTRTRLSFKSAWHRLGGDIMSITDPATTGIAKGESLFDVGEMLRETVATAQPLMDAQGINFETRSPRLYGSPSTLAASRIAWRPLIVENVMIWATWSLPYRSAA